eukprot:gene15745-18670_t
MMQQIQQQMMMLAAANNGAAEAMRQPAVVAPEPGVDADPWTSVVNGMKDDAREIIDEWRLKGLLPRGTVNVIGQVAYNKVAKHIQSRHPQVPLRVVKTYVTNRLSYFEKTTWMVPVAGNTRPPLNSRTSFTSGDVVDIFATAQADVGRIGDDYATGKATKSGISNLAIARAIVAVFGPGKSLNEKPMVLPSDVYELYIECVVHLPEGGDIYRVERLLSHHMSMVDELVDAEQLRTGIRIVLTSSRTSSTP